MSLMFEVHAVGESKVAHPPFTTLEKAKAHGAKVIDDGSSVWIEGTMINNDPENPVPMWGFRYDKNISTWVETSLPFNIEELFNTAAPYPL
ncbi:MAG: hypothetical protein COB59_01680 [Rhodospirillaceae bacterium]|nr:MAG: hypothetical protein COB59_01680 [Rhodospirillaceae bacterium]